MERIQHPKNLFALLLMLSASILAACPRRPQSAAHDSQSQLDHSAATPPTYWLFPTARQALDQILRAQPRVVGFGEYHQKTDSARVRSALHRFSAQILEPLARHATDLIVETWITEGNCGEQEKKVVQKVEDSTKRPATTESELVMMIRRAKEKGIQPHILEVTCEDYNKLLNDSRLDHEQLLHLVTRYLTRKVTTVLKQRSGNQKERGAATSLVAIYGGALHNDLYPMKELKVFTYAPAIRKLVGDRYAEVDLYVPEYVEGDRDLSHEPWYPIMKEHASNRQLLLIERGPGSYILVLRRGIRPR